MIIRLPSPNRKNKRRSLTCSRRNPAFTMRRTMRHPLWLRNARHGEVIHLALSGTITTGISTRSGQSTNMRRVSWYSRLLRSKLPRRCRCRTSILKCKYVGGADSKYPAYVFHASARDLARFGLLYLRHGFWQGRQIIPASWIDRSTKAYSSADDGFGYGFLWWVVAAGSPYPAPPGTFFTWGNGGQFVVVIPEYGLVVVHLAVVNSTGPSGRRGVTLSQMSQLLALILLARPGAG